MPQFAETTGDPREFADKLKTLVAKQGISLEYDNSIAPSQGVSYGAKIKLIPDMQPAEEFSVLVHELAHAMLHKDRGETRLPKVIRETQAEAVAYVVCRGVGLDTNTAAADYIKLYTGDKNTLAESLSVIQETSSRILDELLPEHPLTPPHEKHPERDFANKPDPSREESGRSNLAQSPPADQMPDPSDSISLEH